MIQRQSKRENETQPREMDDISKVISDIEIINIINSELQNPSGITLNMFNINQRYISLLENNGHKCVNQNYKKYLKTLINDSIKNVRFVKPSIKRESEILVHDSKIDTELEKSFENKVDDIATLFKVASIIRREMVLSRDGNLKVILMTISNPNYFSHF